MRRRRISPRKPTAPGAPLLKLALPNYVEGVEAWRLALDLESPVPAEAMATLSADEKAQLLKFFRHEDRIRYAVTRAALRRLLSETLKRAPENLRFLPNKYGKPQLPAAEGVEFNVSHSGRFALIAISERGAVGVDIEQCSAEIDVAGLSPLVLSSTEQEAIKDADAFIERWVLKESILKALGLGIAEHVQATTAERASCGDRLYEAHHPALDMSAVKACLLEAPDGYKAALAWIDR